MTVLNFNISVAAELHMLTLLENLKHQVNQLSTGMNLVMSRLNTTCDTTLEMPDDVSLPLSSLAEVDSFENWLNDPANALKKKQIVSIFQTPQFIFCTHLLFFFLFLSFSISNSIPYF